MTSRAMRGMVRSPGPVKAGDSKLFAIAAGTITRGAPGEKFTVTSRGYGLEVENQIFSVGLFGKPVVERSSIALSIRTPVADKDGHDTSSNSDLICLWS